MSKYQGPVFHKRLQTERIVHKPSPREVKRTQQPIANNDIPFYHKPDYQAASKPAAPAKKPEKQTVSAYEDRTSTPFKVSHVPPPLYGTRKKKTEPKEQIDYQLIFQKLAKTDEEFLLFEEYLSEFGEEVEKSSEEINLTFTIEEPEAEQMEVQEEQTVASVVEETIEEESVIVETEEALPQETVQSMSESIESAIEEPEVEHMEVQAEHAAPITEKTTEPAPVNVETEDNLPQEPVQSVNKAVESEAEEPTQPKEIKKRGLSRSLAGMIQEEQDARLNKGRNIARYFGESLKEVKSKEVKPKAVQDESQPATLSELLAQSRRNQPSSANQLENLLKANEEPYSRKSLQAEKAPEIAEEIQTESEPVKEVAEVPEIIEAVEPQEAVEEAEAVKVPEEEMIEAPQEANTDSTSVTSEQPATITELLARAQAGSTQDLEALIGEEETTAEEETAQEANHSVEEPIESDRKEVNEEFVDTEITENPAEPSEVIQIEPASEETVDAEVVSVERSEAPLVEETVEVEEAPVTEKKVIQPYQFPSLDLLDDPVVFETNAIDDWVLDQAEALNETLEAFNVEAQVVGWTIGPAITQFELQLGRGVKVNKITNLADDLKLSLAAKDIRIEAPIPGKSTVGVEVPNKKSRPVMISEVIGSEEFENSTSPLTIALGVNLAGKKVVTTIDKMPHGLIAGATGSGKSVFINSLLVSLLYKATPNEVKLILIDPKAVELAPYNGLPHLLSPVISEPKAANEALKWAVNEMEERYQKLAAAGVRNLEGFNKKAEARGDYALKLPYIVIIIDELADLMMVASNEVQDSIARITQKARAAGIHLIVATQRPSVDVVTGTIKNNIPTRVAFMVSSQIDSRTILDTGGAEKLLGRGDMLFQGNGSSRPIRVQGTYVEEEIDMIVDFVKQQQEANYLFQSESLLERAEQIEEKDELLDEVLPFIVDQGTVSASSLQRKFRIGFNRASNLIDTLESKNLISENKGSRPRDVFLTRSDYEEKFL